MSRKQWALTKFKKEALLSFFICGIRLRGIPILPSQIGAGASPDATEHTSFEFILGVLDVSLTAVSHAVILLEASSGVIETPFESEPIILGDTILGKEGAASARGEY